MEKLSKAKAKFIKSLQIKKYRQIHKNFLVEGDKIIREVLTSNFKVTMLVGTPEFMEQVAPDARTQCYMATETELGQLGHLKTNNTALAVVEFPTEFTAKPTRGMTLFLDDISDPGNLGTMIRTADWYGVDQIVVSASTVEWTNPKAIQATMGSFLRVPVLVDDQNFQWLKSANVPIWGAVMDGKPIETCSIKAPLILVIGNESKGISKPVRSLCQHLITLPGYGGAESLNAAVATGILLENIRGKL